MPVFLLSTSAFLLSSAFLRNVVMLNHQVVVYLVGLSLAAPQQYLSLLLCN